jgi:hypothetical protein
MTSTTSSSALTNLDNALCNVSTQLHSLGYVEEGMTVLAIARKVFDQAIALQEEEARARANQTSLFLDEQAEVTT